MSYQLTPEQRVALLALANGEPVTANTRTLKALERSGLVIASPPQWHLTTAGARRAADIILTIPRAAR